MGAIVYLFVCKSLIAPDSVGVNALLGARSTHTLPAAWELRGRIDELAARGAQRVARRSSLARPLDESLIH